MTRLAGVAAALVAYTVVGALTGAVRHADEHAGEARAVVELVIDAGKRVGRVRPMWDEVNLWKLQSFFGIDRPDPARWWGPRWMARHAPWARYARLLAAVGGNYASAIAPWCDHALVVPEHPDTGTGECGRGGTPGAAARTELIREADGRTVTDYGPFRVAIGRVLTSGVLPHLNLSAAPAPFTGGATDFSHYHWNAAPVRDLAGWSAFIGDALRAVADLAPHEWRVSITNEPNCLTLVGWQQEIRHVGFAGTPEDYARMFVTGAAAIEQAAPGVHLHAGNYVTSVTFPAEDNLRLYLGALRDGLHADGRIRWDDLWAISLSLYETPDTSLYDFVPVRLARLETAVRTVGLTPRPIKVDELDLHPTIVDAFRREAAEPLDRTLYAASWHAETLRAFIEAGTVVSVAPWLTRMFDLGAFAPYPKARTYELFGMLAGQLRRASPLGEAPAELTGRGGGLPRLAITGESPPAGARPLHPRRGTRLGALATRGPDGVRIVVVHHQNMPVADGSLRQRRLARRVRVLVRDLPSGAYEIRHTSLDAEGGAWNGTTTPLVWRNGGCRRAQNGVIEVTPARRIDANSVWMFEAIRRRRCPGEPVPR